jgi:hypothetical protein
MIRKLLVLSAFLALLPGCEVVILYMLMTDDESQEWSWERDVVTPERGWWEEDVESEDTTWGWPDATPEVTCTASGLQVNGELVIPATEPVDEWFVDQHCWGGSIDYDLDGYEACCSDECCSWGVGHPANQAGLHGDGQWCEWSGMCAAGLTCFEAPPDSGISPGVCRKSKLKEWCDPEHGCSDLLYCALGLWQENNKWEGICLYHVAVEGQPCIPAGGEPCLAPMQCVCPLQENCKCWDGSEGDPCQPKTCQAGLECVSAEDGEPGEARCYDGNKGDPCTTDWNCKEGLECRALAEGRRCVSVIPLNEPCATGTPYSFCVTGAVCNTWYVPPICSLPGALGQPCLLDAECGSALFCVAALQACFAGKPGDPCGTQTDCVAGCFCQQTGQVGHCVQYLDSGAACLPADPDLKCLPGLTCRKLDAAGDPACLPPTDVKGAYCDKDPDCVLPLECIEDLALCSTGHDGEPCSGDGDCAVGWKCAGEPGLCFNGNTGDPCKADLDCATGFQCSVQTGKCHAGTHGLPCTGAAECGDGLVCVEVGSQAVCVELLSLGDPCGSAAPPFSLCGAGLQCDTALDLPVCAEPN